MNTVFLAWTTRRSHCWRSRIAAERELLGHDWNLLSGITRSLAALAQYIRLVCAAAVSTALMWQAGAAAQTRTAFVLPNSYPVGITAGPDGALWFTGNGANSSKIGRITTAGVITEFLLPTANSGPNSITTAPDGALWFTESGTSKIGRITTAGVITEFLLPTTDSHPNGITTGPDGALWFTEFNASKIGRITTAGAITEFSTPTIASNPNGITTGPDGALWFTESGTNKIGRITTTGVITEFPLSTANSFPGSITAGPDGALWFTDIHKIGRITTAGVITEFLLPASSPCVPTPGQPVGIAARGGALWFTAYTGCVTSNEVGRITTTGIFTLFQIGMETTSLGGSDIGPIAAGPDGALWFTGTVGTLEGSAGVIERLAVTINTHDFNGDGFSDIAWRDTSGNTAVWLMDGAQVIQSANIGAAPTEWTIVR